MGTLSLRLAYNDKHRAWSELVVAVERASGLLLVPTEANAVRGEPCALEIAIAREPPIALAAVVERVRRSTPRFSRALLVRLDDAARALLGARLGAHDVDGAASFGRHAPRFELAWPVTFRTPAVLGDVDTRDLSAEGMHIVMPDRVFRGDVVEFTLHTPQGHHLMLRGEVQWTSELTDRVGIRFLYKEAEDQDLMRALLLHAVGTRLSVLGKAAILVLADDEPRFDALRAATSLPIEITQNRADALRVVREERPRAFLLSERAPDLVGLVRAIAGDAELLGVQLVLFGDDPARLRAAAREVGVYHALLTPVTDEGARELVHALDLVEE